MPNPTTTHVWWGADTASDFRGFAGLFAQHYGNLPTFVGRYVNNYPPSAEELAWDRANHIAVLLICNAEDGSTSDGDYSDGFLLGAQAAAKASAMGYPKGSFLPVDLEATFVVSVNFLVGYFHGVDQGKYVPGAYLNVLNQEHVSAWIAARKQYSLPAYIYSSEPEPYLLWEAVNPAFYDFTQTGLGTAYAGDVVIWQYGEGELSDDVDLDVATDKGYSLLWTPEPLPPIVYRVRTKSTLKVHPNHACGPALDGNNKPIPALLPGAIVKPTGQRTPHWSEYSLPDSALHGWLLASSVT